MKWPVRITTNSMIQINIYSHVINMYACINIAAITSFRASRTLDFGCICALATESQSTWLVRPGNKPGFNDILWKAMSMYEMWQLLHSILNTLSDLK